MVVLVLGAIEGNGAGALDGHRECWKAGGLARCADEEARVEGAVGLAGSAAASTSRSDGVVLEMFSKGWTR